jgi:N-acetyl-anhydromuramyl-L-alanine amidase AmpD
MRVPGIRYVQGRNSYVDADGRKFGIAIHNTANNATAEGEASYATRRTDTVSSHFYVDRTMVIQSLDTNARAGHAASKTGNENAIAVEITGTNDKSRSWWLANVAWGELGRVLAVVCKAYGITPRRASVAEMKSNPTVKAFYSHNDMRLAWGGTTHTDPGPNFPWDKLFQAVNSALNPQEDDDMSDYGFEAASGFRLNSVYGDVRNGVIPVLATINANLAALAGKDFVNEQEVVDGVLAGLGGKSADEIRTALQAALPPDTFADLFPQS